MITLMATARLVWSAEVDSIEDLVKSLGSSLVNMGLIGLGFFFGNTSAKLAADRGQQRLMERLTSAPPGTLPPPPTNGPQPWWPKLAEDEKTKLTDAATNDQRVRAFITASMIGAATPDDLAYIVTAGLLTQARADEIQK
jgi:hypothetical protein